ncbi:MAG: tetratricopeptide repeat protein [Candidatus Atribacteria bacterium]|nr:MAG: tetratricopeptide repeat protein [Candidatus Atribacteria bacterium]
MPRNQPAPSREALACVLDKALVYTVALLLLSIPLFILTTVSEYGYGKTIFALVGISLLSILWGATGWVKGTWKIHWPWITAPFLGFVVASLLSLLFAVNGRVVIQSLVLVVFFFQLSLVIANVVRERKDVQILLFALLLSGFLASLYGLLQYLGVLRGPFGGTGLPELISTLGNRNYLGGFLAYLLFPSVILVISPRWRWVRAVSIPMIAFCFGTALLVQQTAVVVSLAVAAIAWGVGWAIFRPVTPLRKNRLWILILLALLVITFLVEAPSGPLNSVVGLSADEQSWIGRIWEQQGGKARSWDWWVGWEMFVDSPVVGVGLGNYKLNFLFYKAQFLATPRGEAYTFYIARAAQAHNDYVQALAEVGILGMLAVLGFIVTLAVSLWIRLRQSKDEQARLELLFLACGIIPFLVHALVSFPAHLPASSLVFIAIIGIIFSRAYGHGTVWTRSLSGWPLRAAVSAIAVIGIVISSFAVSDLSANILMYEGVQQMQRGNDYAAEALLSKSLDADFAPRQTYYHLAMVELRLERFDDAWENLEMCMTRFLDEGVYLTYANLAAKRRELAKAQAAVDVLLAGRPLDVVEQQARYIEAVIATQEGDYGRAVQLLEALTQDHPNYETGFIALGDLYAAQGLWNSARRSLETALELVDNKLQSASEKLKAGSFITVADYGQIRAEIELQTQQRDIVIDRLNSLP